jgi:hypothetical protein
MTRSDEDISVVRGFMFGLLFSIPIWFSIIMLATWLINR